MRKSFVPIKDSSIYEQFPDRNTGHDEIVDIGKSSSGTYSIRSLIQFDIGEVSQSVSTQEIPWDSIFELKLFVARADDLPLFQTIELGAVSESWDEGSGYFFQNVNIPFTASRGPVGGFFETDGTTWNNRSDGIMWSVPGATITGSLNLAQISDPVRDMNIDVTSIVKEWISGSIPSNGFLVKFPDVDEQNINVAGNIKFFSRQTHTIYVPLLIARWNSQQYITGSISGSNIDDMTVIPRNVSSVYKMGEIVKIDLSVRDRYPLKTFDTLFSNYLGNQRLPQTSYFSIVDIQSNTDIIPFGIDSFIDSDGQRSLFQFRVEGGMYPGRFYKILIKVEDQGQSRIFDSGHHFTVQI